MFWQDIDPAYYGFLLVYEYLDTQTNSSKNSELQFIYFCRHEEPLYHFLLMIWRNFKPFYPRIYNLLKWVDLNWFPKRFNIMLIDIPRGIDVTLEVFINLTYSQYFLKFKVKNWELDTSSYSIVNGSFNLYD